MGKEVTVKNTATASDLLAQYQKEHGDSIGSFGGTMMQADRIPTGIFSLDLALGGGFPRGKCSIVYGPESSSKTNIVLLMIANHQRMFPFLKCIFIDVENAYDKAWAKRLGVDVEKLIVIKPGYAEQAVDMAENFLYAEDCGIVAIDSLAALMTTAEGESEAGKAQPGGPGLVIGKLCRRTGHALSEAEKQGRFPMVVYINQIRHKIGVMFGDPETMPGGNAPRFQTSMWLRVYGKNVKDTKISPDMPVAKEVNFVIKKWKCPILAASGRFEQAMLPYKGLKPGQQTDEDTVIIDYLEGYGLFEKDKKGWNIVNEIYPTQQAFAQRLIKDIPFAADLKKHLMARIFQDSPFMEEGEDGVEKL